MSSISIGVAIADQYEQEVEIVGTVVAVEWDEDVNAIEIEVDSDQDVYPIELEGEGAELLDYVGDVLNIQGEMFF